MANKLGDPTAKAMGRLTLNPIAHADPFGTILFPLISFFTGAALFGWAKPVPVNERNFKNWSRDGLLVAAAGPVSNLILAVAFTGVLAVLRRVPSSGEMVQAGFMISEPLVLMCFYGIQLNLVLALFNLIPVPPLDGGRVAMGLFPALAPQFRALERFGFVLIFALLFTGVLGKLVFLPAHLLMNWLVGLTA